MEVSLTSILVSFLVKAEALLPCYNSSGPTANLGYATYQGYYDEFYGLNIWKGIRYAAPPTGALRWQAPQEYSGHATKVTPAIDQPPLCPQTGAYGVPEEYGFKSSLGNEDCLYLNVYAAPNATNLPVLAWIHGGGYGDFGAQYNPSVFINTNDNAFVVVEIQYRLGAFGFLASEDVHTNGQLNVGLLDQRMALQWVQHHIARFGGDPSRVTIGGESSGAGSVMFHALAHGGEESGLFNNVIAASPYTPAIHRYNDSIPTAYYNHFAEHAGCGEKSTLILTQHQSVFDCSVSADSDALQYASGNVAQSYGYFGSWAGL